MKSNSIVFFGTADFSAASLEALIASGQTISAIVTKPDTPQGRGQKLEPPLVKSIAEAANIPVLQPEKSSDILEALKPYELNTGVVVAYGKILPQEVIDAFPDGLINIHASLLPKYRGPSPIEAALLNCDEETGISIMRIDLKMDAGDVYAQEKVKLMGNETKPQMYQLLSKLGAESLIRNLPKIMSGELKATPQDESKATYTKLITKQEAQIDWSWPANKIERHTRAYLGWPGSKAVITGREVSLKEVSVSHSSGPSGKLFKSPEGLGVYCGEDAIIVKQLQPAGKKVMSGNAFATGLSRTTF